MNTRTAALVAALTDALGFAERAWGLNSDQADQTMARWRAALAAATVIAPDDNSATAPVVKFHLDQAVDAMGEVWDHALAIIEQMPDCAIGEVLETVQALAVDTPVAGLDVVASDIPLPMVVGISGEWRTTQRRRRRAKGLPTA